MSRQVGLGKVGSAPAQDLVLLLGQLDPLVRFTQCVGEPALQARRRDAEVLRDLGDYQGARQEVSPQPIDPSQYRGNRREDEAMVDSASEEVT